ncbi:polysaccharide deacetylase family protein [Paenibacillus sp. y28]|uniref:polysaccharide deacetylase family protein n=1 Tax=Paenibacillus sp. y28 TaxID=3129110 RepID=UPI003015CCB9
MLSSLTRTFILFIICTALLLPTLSASRDNIMYKDQVAVLMYHHVHDTDKSSGTITTQLFSDQLEYLIEKGYNFISMEQFDEFMNGGSVPPNAALVTFDDGYNSFYTNAYPVLKRLHIPSITFMITETLDNPNKWNIPFMTRGDLAAMTMDSTLAEPQCHTHGMHNKTNQNGAYLITRLPTADGGTETHQQYDSRVVNDIKQCAREIQSVAPGIKVDHLAYPYGIYDAHSIELLKQAGMKYAFTIVPEMATRDVDLMQIPRINAGGPYISPQSLHNSILRRVVATHAEEDEVPLGKTLKQLGGFAHMEGDNIDINYHGKLFYAKSDSNIVLNEQGDQIELSQPIIKKERANVIRLVDLEKILGDNLVYNPATLRYIVRTTPVRQVN